MKKDSSVFISHILESICAVENYIKDITEEKFSRSPQIQDAVIRRLEIIGEAAKNVPLSIRNKNSQIPWKKLAGMRDVLIHGYFGVNLEQVWDTAKNDLKKLKPEILKITLQFHNHTTTN